MGEYGKLKYILAVGLPKSQERLLEQNFSDKENAFRTFEILPDTCLYLYGYFDSEVSGAKIIKKPAESFPDDFLQYPPQETLIVTAESCCLELANTYDIAAVAYLEPGRNAFFGEDGKALSADLYAEGFDEIGPVYLERIYARHHRLPWKILETKRCIVQEFSMEWLPDLFSLYAGEGMTDYIEPLYEYEKEKEYQRAYIENMYCFYGFGMWIVRQKDTGKLIGRAGLECREDLDGEMELGYAIGVPWQNQGYAAEVCTEILSYAKEELGVSHICCVIEPGNERSVRLAQKLGFVLEKELVLDQRVMLKYEKKL